MVAFFGLFFVFFYFYFSSLAYFFLAKNKEKKKKKRKKEESFLFLIPTSTWSFLAEEDLIEVNDEEEYELEDLWKRKALDLEALSGSLQKRK